MQTLTVNTHTHLSKSPNRKYIKFSNFHNTSVVFGFQLTREPGSQPQILRVVRPGQPVAGTIRGAQSIGQPGAKSTAAKIIVTKSASGQNIAANEPIAGGPQGQ